MGTKVKLSSVLGFQGKIPVQQNLLYFFGNLLLDKCLTMFFVKVLAVVFI